MRKNLLVTGLLLAGITLFSCGSKPSAQSVAQKWCDLNEKAYKASDGPEKQAAEAAREKYEDEMEAKYKKDDAFMKEVEKEVEKCEGASEGR